MRRVPDILIAAAAGLAMYAGAALAQEVEIEAPSPVQPRAPIVVPPGDHYQMTRPSDADYYRQPPRVRYDPTFVGPLSAKRQTPTTTGRLGVAGWTSPNTPVGPMANHQREVAGWFAFGLAFEWGGPPPPGEDVR